jgi:hypothetical protein
VNKSSDRLIITSPTIIQNIIDVAKASGAIYYIPQKVRRFSNVNTRRLEAP